MDLSVKVTFDVSPKFEELVFLVLAAVATGKENNIIVAEPVPMKTKQQETVAKPQKIVAKPQETEAKADIPGKEVPKAEAEKLKEIADLPLDGDELIELRKQASEFMGKNHKDNTQAIKDWLDARNIERVTLIPRSMVEEFRKDVLGIAG